MNESQSYHYHQIGAIFLLSKSVLYPNRMLQGISRTRRKHTGRLLVKGGEILILRQECVSLILFWGEHKFPIPNLGEHKPQVL